MEFLKDIYGVYNIAVYPEPIRKLIALHKIQCQRRHYKLCETKVILAIPWRESLREYTNEIQTSQVNNYYDHMIYMNGFNSTFIPDQPLTIANPEEYIVNISPSKQRKLKAPEGIRIEVTEELKPVTETCIRKWFSNGEVFWLI